MKCLRLGLVLLTAIVTTVATAEDTLRSRALESATKALDAMADFQRHGGWGSAWSLDQKVVWGEWLPIPENWITVQAPATPIAAGVFLRAGQVLDESRWIAVAEKAHGALKQLQSPDGGFPHEGAPAEGNIERATFDDGVTTDTLYFFIDWWKYTEAAADRAAMDSVGEFLLTAQYRETGGWPQSWPPPASYGRCITFNDGNYSNIIHALFTLVRETGDMRYRDAALRGGECILRLQGPGEESIWAQQYDPETLEPAWARKFEPPGYSPAESAAVCDTLVELFLQTGDERYVTSLGRALTWYESHKLENGKYARLYEPGTQRPVYGRRDKAEKVYDFAEACEGYGWQGSWYPSKAKAAYDAIQGMGGEAYREVQSKAKVDSGKSPSEDTIRKICDLLTPDGHWVRNPSAEQKEVYTKHEVDGRTPMVLLRDFNVHMGQLLDYIEATK